MTLRTIPHAAVDGSLRVLRWPLDTTLRLTGRDGDGAGSAASLAVDRIDATVRALVGTVIGDAELRHDAERRRLAADQRAKALRLRAEAAHRDEQAQERLAVREREAEAKRRDAARSAERRKQRAEEQRKAKARDAVKAEQQRKQANAKTAAKREEAIDDRARESRLEQLDEQAEALASKEEALIAKDEARRLSRAAGAKKAARKAAR